MYTIYGIDVADAWEKEKKNGFKNTNLQNLAGLLPGANYDDVPALVKEVDEWDGSCECGGCGIAALLAKKMEDTYHLGIVSDECGRYRVFGISLEQPWNMSDSLKRLTRAKFHQYVIETVSLVFEGLNFEFHEYHIS